MAPAEPDGTTPLEDADLDGLKPTWVSTRSELNQVEQDNIVKAIGWVNGRTWTRARVLDERALKRLHHRMFGDVWTWAGTYRRTQKRFGDLVGPDHWRVPLEVVDAIADAGAQIDALPPAGDAARDAAADEVAVRLHHRLVVIHPFANGNGRWSRQVASLLARALDRPDLTWSGIGPGVAGGADRAGYIAALRAADGHDVGPLTRFARS